MKRVIRVGDKTARLDLDETEILEKYFQGKAQNLINAFLPLNEKLRLEHLKQMSDYYLLLHEMMKELYVKQLKKVVENAKQDN